MLRLFLFVQILPLFFLVLVSTRMWYIILSLAGIIKTTRVRYIPHTHAVLTIVLQW